LIGRLELPWVRVVWVGDKRIDAGATTSFPKRKKDVI